MPCRSAPYLGGRSPRNALSPSVAAVLAPGEPPPVPVPVVGRSVVPFQNAQELGESVAHVGAIRVGARRQLPCVDLAGSSFQICPVGLRERPRVSCVCGPVVSLSLTLRVWFSSHWCRRPRPPCSAIPVGVCPVVLRSPALLLGPIPFPPAVRVGLPSRPPVLLPIGIPLSSGLCVLRRRILLPLSVPLVVEGCAPTGRGRAFTLAPWVIAGTHRSGRLSSTRSLLGLPIGGRHDASKGDAQG